MRVATNRRVGSQFSDVSSLFKRHSLAEVPPATAAALGLEGHLDFQFSDTNRWSASR